MTFGVLPEAELEAAEAALWYEDRRPGLGSDFVAELDRAFERIRTGPAEMPRLETYDGSHEVRRCLLKRFPYLVIFVIRPQSAIVVAVSHARRRPLYWLDRLENRP